MTLGKNCNTELLLKKIHNTRSLLNCIDSVNRINTSMSKYIVGEWGAADSTTVAGVAGIQRTSRGCLRDCLINLVVIQITVLFQHQAYDSAANEYEKQVIILKLVVS